MPVIPSEELDRVLIALSDTTRRAIPTTLAAGPQRVTNVARPFALSLNSVSKHLRILESAGMVTRERRGREHIISINPRPLQGIQAWLIEQQEVWGRRMRDLENHLDTRPSSPTENLDKY
ncbi:MAG: ArsR/SmtB family transcription factor [Candidatus Dormibacteraceae bacterium]